MGRILEVGERFVADSRIRTVSKRLRKAGQITYVDEHGNRYPAGQVQPINAEMALNESDLTTLVMMIEAMVESGEFELDLLETLNAAQKRQLWDALTPPHRNALIQAKKAAA